MGRSTSLITYNEKCDIHTISTLVFLTGQKRAWYTVLMNTKVKGDIAVAHAIALYTELGYEVLLPLGDKQPYDLVIDTKESLQKVQVKYAGTSDSGKTVAWLRTVGGNQSFQTAKKYLDTDFDILFVWTACGKGYSIPWSALTNRVSVTLSGGKYEKYRINLGV